MSKKLHQILGITFFAISSLFLIPNSGKSMLQTCESVGDLCKNCCGDNPLTECKKKCDGGDKTLLDHCKKECDNEDIRCKKDCDTLVGYCNNTEVGPPPGKGKAPNCTVRIYLHTDTAAKSCWKEKCIPPAPRLKDLYKPEP